MRVEGGTGVGLPSTRTGIGRVGIISRKMTLGPEMVCIDSNLQEQKSKPKNLAQNKIKESSKTKHNHIIATILEY